MFALAACARASINAQPDPLTHDAHSQLISDYETLVPHISPSRSPYILWHPDLHASNIITTDTTRPCKLTGIIDWQGAIVAPYYTQLDPPMAFTAEEHPLVDSSLENGPELSSGVDALPDEQKRLAHLAHRRAWRQKLHEILVRDQDPVLADDLYSPMGVAPKRAMTSPAVAITRGTTEGLAFIRHSFLTSRRLWGLSVGVDENGAPLKPFPLDISDADEQRVEEEWVRHRSDASMADKLLQSLGIPWDGDGIVDVDEYEVAMCAAEEARQAVLDGATTQEERDRLERAWPLQDGKVSLTAELCC